MEGYSVTEAASVLGVPTERVWELLARGVLSGAPEGETGMRVYLQPRPAPAPVEPKGPNGNGGSREPERELSPFRELLTEFRNLTERYGQALLALGEARGEVAALRSRVDLLEARMDLRLPIGQPQAAGWSSAPMPSPPLERAVMPARGDAVGEAADAASRDATRAAVVEPEPTEEERRSRARGPRRATESFAEALARAEDPSPPELPGGPEAAAALAALRQPSEGAADIELPRDVAVADAIPVADAEAQTIAAEPEPVKVTPDPIADEAGPTLEPAEDPVPVVAAEPEARPVVDAEEPVAPDPRHAADDIAQLEPSAEAESTVAAVTPEPVEQAGEAAAETAPKAAVAESTVPDVEPIEWDAERYTTDIEEPDWFAAEVVGTPEVDAAGDPDASAGPDPSAAADAAAERALPAEVLSPADVASSEPEGQSMGLQHAEQAPGADEMEVASARQRETAQPDVAGDDTTQAEIETAQPPVSRTFPGAHDLEDAIAALRAAGRAAEASQPAPQPQPASKPAEDLLVDSDEWPPRSTFARPTSPGAATRGPASRAYRRLRRIFPG